MNLPAEAMPDQPPHRVPTRPAIGHVPGLTLAARGLLHVLEELADDHGVVRSPLARQRSAYIAEIATVAEIAPRMVSKHLEALDRVNLIRRRNTGAALPSVITVLSLAGG